jgi:sugar phosphate isomerase/epimerase
VSFRLGATSFVYPASWLDNVERLGGRVDDIELLFFEADAYPDGRELQGLAVAKARHALTYTLHTPLGPSLASADVERRRAGVDAVAGSIAAAAPVSPEQVVVHVYLGDRENDARPRDLAAWRARARGSLEALLATGIAPRDVCVEWLDYDLRLLLPVIEELDLSVALDVGHLARDGVALEAALDAALPRTRCVQWHGTAPGGRDHVSLTHFPRHAAHLLLRRLRDHAFAGVITLEVFEAQAFERSLAYARACMDEALT